MGVLYQTITAHFLKWRFSGTGSLGRSYLLRDAPTWASSAAAKQLAKPLNDGAVLLVAEDHRFKRSNPEEAIVRSRSSEALQEQYCHHR
jgi:hypothetical protein